MLNCIPRDHRVQRISDKWQDFGCVYLTVNVSRHDDGLRVNAQPLSIIYSKLPKEIATKDNIIQLLLVPNTVWSHDRYRTCICIWIWLASWCYYDREFTTGMNIARAGFPQVPNHVGMVARFCRIANHFLSFITNLPMISPGNPVEN